MGRAKKLVAAMSITLWPSVSHGQVYSMENLDVGSGFDGVQPYGISQNGKITGVGVVPVTGDIHAFTYSNGEFHDLGDLGALYGSDGVAINNSGQVSATGYGPGYYAMLYSNGQARRIGSIDGGSSVGLAINNLGHIVGRAMNGDGGNQGFKYLGSFTALSVDIARGINDSDQVVGSVGYSWVQYGYVHVVEHAFVVTGNNLVDIGNLGGGLRTSTEAYAINNAGQVTGYSTTSTGAMHAFVYSGGTMADLRGWGPYSTIGMSINSAGEVLGSIQNGVGSQLGTFLYSNGVMNDLSDLLGSTGAGWSQLQATQISDAGWIVGVGTLNGETHGFLARPCAADFNADGALDFFDYDDFVTCFEGGDCPPGKDADFDGDGSVDFFDYDAFVAAFESGC